MLFRRACIGIGSGLGLLLALGLASPGLELSAWAGPSAPKTSKVSPLKRKQAQARFAKARALYKSGKYRAAIDELSEAVALDPEGAEMIYNLGLLHEKLGEVDHAIEQYRRYVEMNDDPQEKKRVQGIIERLEGARPELVTPPGSASASASGTPDTEPGPPATIILTASAPAPTEAPRHGVLDGWVIASGAVALAGIGVGIAYGAKAMSDRLSGTPTTNEATTYQDLQDRTARAKREAVIADIGFGVALAAGVTGAVLYFAREQEPDKPTTTSRRVVPSFAVLPGGVAAAVRVGF